ncbi:MAG: hypothetical protein Ct9H300mP25_03250 [Acidobacteriota bacterium]|nr:MAG: hypothetical protein Ct9H300mP25_03250 [Acidobacteriota bacterium]
MGAVAANMSDRVVLTSDNPRSEQPLDIIADIECGLLNTKTPYVTNFPTAKKPLCEQLLRQILEILW